MQVQAGVMERYQTALNSLTARLEEDYYVLAAVLYGSMARGEPWEKSDIDLVIILRDGQDRDVRALWIVEDDVNISASVITRSRFKRYLDGELQGSFIHSIRSQHKLLFSKDDSIAAWVRESSRVGEHDQALMLMSAASWALWQIDKAEKWLYVKRDPNYAFVWILNIANALARLEVLWNGEAPGREVLDQALRFNPEFFRLIYIDLINGLKNEESLRAALDAVNGYLDERAARICKPLLDYLAEAGGPVPVSELNNYFRKKIPNNYLDGVYEWLSRRGVIQKLSSPIHLTRKSQVTLEEPAFYYDAPDDSIILSDWE